MCDISKVYEGKEVTVYKVVKMFTVGHERAYFSIFANTEVKLGPVIRDPASAYNNRHHPAYNQYMPGRSCGFEKLKDAGILALNVPGIHADIHGYDVVILKIKLARTPHMPIMSGTTNGMVAFLNASDVTVHAGPIIKEMEIAEFVYQHKSPFERHKLANAQFLHSI